MPAAAFVLLLTYALIFLQRLPRTPIRSPAGVLFGALLMVALGVLPFESALQSIHLDIVLFLLGILVIAVYLEAGNTVSFFAGKVLRFADSPLKLLVAFLVLGALVSALALNLTAAILLAPMVLVTCRRVGEKPVPYLVSLMLGINLGSAATAIGSPQTMLVVSLAKDISFFEYTSKMALLSLLGVVIAGFWVVFFYRKRLGGRSFRETLQAIPSLPLNFTGLSALAVSLVVVALLLAGAPMALAALLGAAVLLAVNPQPPRDVLSIVNWPLLILLGSLFVVVAGVAESGIAAWFADSIVSGLEGNTAAQVGALSALLSGMLALFSDLPSAALILPLLKDLGDMKILWYTLALVSTFAGNMTLYGSLSNIAVLEVSAKKQLRIGYLDFLKVGLPLSVITLAIGIFYVART